MIMIRWERNETQTKKIVEKRRADFFKKKETKHKLLARLNNKKEKPLNYNWDITTINSTTQWIIREYGQLYTKRLHKLETEKFLEPYSLPRLKHETKANLNMLITTEEIESVIKNLPIKKSQTR